MHERYMHHHVPCHGAKVYLFIFVRNSIAFVCTALGVLSAEGWAQDRTQFYAGTAHAYGSCKEGACVAPHPHPLSLSCCAKEHVALGLPAFGLWQFCRDAALWQEMAKAENFGASRYLH